MEATDIKPSNKHCHHWRSLGSHCEACAKLDRIQTRLAREHAKMVALITRMLDPSPCRYDHNGLCQEHSLDPRPCPQEEARALLSKIKTKEG